MFVWKQFGTVPKTRLAFEDTRMKTAYRIQPSDGQRVRKVSPGTSRSPRWDRVVDKEAFFQEPDT